MFVLTCPIKMFEMLLNLAKLILFKHVFNKSYFLNIMANYIALRCILKHKNKHIFNIHKIFLLLYRDQILFLNSIAFLNNFTQSASASSLDDIQKDLKRKNFCIEPLVMLMRMTEIHRMSE